jgi:hypothetical protein
VPARLGEARKVGSAGFGQQRRLAVVFHRMIMPDGYSVDLDQFHGLDQIGEEGLKDKVNNHYFQIFGTSIALGVISGAGEIEFGGGTITTSGSQAFTTGAASSVSQSATTVLDRFIQIPPTITIREGHRVKVYFTQDMLLLAYDNHTIPQSFWGDLIMWRVVLSAILVAPSLLALTGCESHQSRVDALQKEYNKLATQFQGDCSAAYYKVPPTLSPKCENEKKQMDDAWKRLQDERTKK